MSNVVRLVEIAGNFFNVLAILLAALNNANTWVCSFFACFMLGILFFKVKLYADCSLQVFFMVLSIIGWWNWAWGGKNTHGLPVKHISLLSLSFIIIAGIIATAIYTYVLSHYTDDAAPFLDSSLLVCAVIAQLLLIKRKYENWWFWLMVNTIAVPLYITRGLYLTSFLYFLYWINAIVALVRWRKLIVK